MKQRLGIIQSILNDPRILILDEPTADLQNIANNIIMMKSGKIICTGDEEKLLKQLEGVVVIVMILYIGGLFVPSGKANKLYQMIVKLSPAFLMVINIMAM